MKPPLRLVPDLRAWDLAQAELHDLRGLLASVVGAWELVEGGVIDASEALERLHDEADRLDAERLARFEATMRPQLVAA